MTLHVYYKPTNLIRNLIWVNLNKKAVQFSCANKLDNKYYLGQLGQEKKHSRKR